MPLWKIAWRSIQRRSLASVLTMLSMALGVMLVVAVLLIVGVVDRSFQSNSSLGYDTIVGAKGGQLQLTLNTVYYLSNPVENLPYSFYQEYLPAEARDETPNDGKAGQHYLEEIEVEIDGKWEPVDDNVTIPAGTMAIRLRVPLLKRASEEFEATANDIQINSTVSGFVDAVLVSSGDAVEAGQPLALIKALEDQLGSSSFDKPSHQTTATRNQDPNEKKFKLRLEVTSEENLNNKSASAIATLLTNVDESISEEIPPTPPESASAKEPAKKTTLKVNSVLVQPDATHAVFVARLYKVLGTDVTFKVQLVDGYDGEYVRFLAPDKISAIPVCLGDFYGQFRVVGTTADFFRMVYDLEYGRTYEFADGGNFTGEGEHGVFEAIVGAKVAREKGIQVGDLIQPSHGTPEGETHDDFEVVGVLASSGTPQDRAVFVNMDGFNQISMHVRADGMTEVTSLLVDTRDPLRSRDLVHQLSEGKTAQGVKPVLIIYGLFSKIVGPIRNLLLVITLLICVVSGISILVSIYNSMSDRRQEIAVMRSLGAGRSTVMTIVLLESVMISLVGGLLGWIAGHALIGLASGKIESETGVVVSALDLAPPMQELSYLLGEQLTPSISVEIWLIPMLIVLAIIVGFLPAWTAYNTDVANALQSSP